MKNIREYREDLKPESSIKRIRERYKNKRMAKSLHIIKSLHFLFT